MEIHALGEQIAHQIVNQQRAALAVDTAGAVTDSVFIHGKRPRRAFAHGEDRVHVRDHQKIDRLIGSTVFNQ